jgi:hypothetical protein
MTTKEKIMQLYNAMEWIESVALTEEDYIDDMLEGIQQTIDILEQLQTNGTIN